MVERILKTMGLFTAGIAVYNYLTSHFNDELFVFSLLISAFLIYLSERASLPIKLTKPSTA